MSYVQDHTAAAKAILCRVLEEFDFEGRNQLLAQVPSIAVSGKSTSLSLEVTDDRAEAANLPDGILSAGAYAFDGDGQPIGDVSIWVKDGYLSSLELGWVTDERPTEIPLPEQLRFN